MTSQVALARFEILRPAVESSQSDSLRFIADAHSLAGGEKSDMLIRRFGVKPDQIGSRGLESYQMSGEVRSILSRTEFFGERAAGVMREFYPLGSRPPAHLIHVTCTGYISPSAAQRLVSDRGWGNQTQVTHAYHMGCYASLPAVRMGRACVLAGDSQVDLVHTEMCSLHLNPELHTPEQIVVQTLFADGYVKYSVLPVEQVGSGLRVVAIKEQVIADSQLDMTWITADWGMHMTLSRDVPRKISAALESFVRGLATDAKMDWGTLQSEGIFAVHPGGPRIIDSVEQSLGLQPWQVQASREVLFRYGNMSSATLPHVWRQILGEARPGQKVVSLAFGPGLTVFGGIFEVIGGAAK